MIKSMTGFSKAETSDQGITASVEIKSVNGRYLETSVKLPKSLNHKEFDVREATRKALTRGSVFVNINVQQGTTSQLMKFNEEAATEYFSAIEKLKKRLKIKEPITLSHLFAFADGMVESKQDDASEKVWKLVSKSLGDALKELDVMRKKEGNEIARDLRNRIKIIEESLAKIEDKAVQRIPEERERLRQRIAQLFESDEIDEQRLQLEIVILADKLDISEECVRLRSHIKFFHETMKQIDAGRKLNFLLQEMHREVNTIGSKANDAEIAQIVVTMKEELERTREQVQNIE
ncbi:MAG: YicC family protein [Bacteroidetes bacterium]|nr:YicC family protein [Bacteroidota bacterium]